MTSPLRPSSGIHEIMRMTFEVQNGIVQSRNSPICQVVDADMEGEEIGDRKADEQRHGPDDEAELQRSSHRSCRIVQRSGKLGDAALERLGIAAQA